MMHEYDARRAIIAKLRMAGVVSGGLRDDAIDWVDVVHLVDAAFTRIAQTTEEATRILTPREQMVCCHIGERERAEAIRLRERFPNADETRVCELIRYDFDNSENRDALITRSIGVFGRSGGLTARTKVSHFLAGLLPERRYAGWDDQVYPQFKIREIQIR